MLELILYDLGVFLSFIGIPVGLFLGVGRIFEGIVKKLNPKIERRAALRRLQEMAQEDATADTIEDTSRVLQEYFHDDELTPETLEYFAQHYPRYIAQPIPVPEEEPVQEIEPEVSYNPAVQSDLEELRSIRATKLAAHQRREAALAQAEQEITSW